MRRNLRKGVPSLGADICSIFEAMEERGSGDGEVGGTENGELPLGKPAPVLRDAYDLRKHPVQQLVMGIVER